MRREIDAIRRVAEHVVRTTHDDLSLEATAAAKTFLADTIAVAVAGSGEPLARSLCETAVAWGAGEDATVWGTRQRLPAPSAALVNAFQIHGLEFDCVHEGAVVHPMATLLAALMAHAERREGITGRQLLTAITVGVDVAASLGLAARGAMQFFRPATAGAFGATAALGKLDALDVDRLISAFGLVYGHVSGTLQPHAEGSPVLALQMGFNARGALTAVDLAARGFPGPREVLEGQYGYFRLFERDHYDLAPVLPELGRVFRVAELSHKPFPTGRLTHGVIDGLLTLQRRHRFTAAEIERVVARVPPLVRRLVGRPVVPAPSPSYARLCLPWVAATALLRGTVDVPDFRGEALRDPAVDTLARRIDVTADDNPDENAMVPQRVAVTLRDGVQHELLVPAVVGSPGRPLSREQHLEKFRRCWRHGAVPLEPGQGERLIELVDRLEEVSDVRALLALTVPQ